MIPVNRLNQWFRTHQHVAAWSTFAGVCAMLYYALTGQM